MRSPLPWAGLALLVVVGCGPKAPSASGTRQAGARTAPTRPSATPVTFKVTSGGAGRGRVVLTERRRGRTVYVLQADANVSNRFGAGTGRSVFTRPHIVFYQARGKTLVADSPTASVDEQSKSILMSGGVHAHTQDGITLVCDELLYDDRSEMIHGRGNVVVTTPRGESLAGDTLDSDVELNRVRVSGAGS